MLDFLPLPFTSLSHRLPGLGANSLTTDEIPDSSPYEHGTYDATTAPPAAHVTRSDIIHQAESTAHTSSRSPSSLFSQFGKWNHHSIQFSSRNSYLSSLRNKTRSPPSSSTVARRDSGKKREALEKSTDGSQSESESINLGVKSAQPEQKMDSIELPISSLTRRPVRVRKVPVQLTPQPSSTTRPPFFRRDTSVQQSSPSDHPNDGFFDLNIQATLFPTGLADPYSPAAYNSLAQKAEQLLSRFQAVYQDCHSSLREITAEKETQAEELEGCQTRARHLQMQLDKMTAKFVEQDQAMMKLVDELAREKYLQQQQRQSEPRTPKRGAKPIITVRADPTQKNAPKNSETPVSRRGSDISTLSIISDSGFESDEESLIGRIGVKHRDTPSPSASVSSLSTTNSRDFTRTANLPPPAISYPIATAQPPRPKGPIIRKPNLLPSAARNPAAPPLTTRDPFNTSCSNCQGARASEAWNVVSVLQDENRGLKERLGHLEGSLDECLDLVRMMGGTGRMIR